jgi:transcriptional regulator with XRE-family HTH domain
VDYIDNTKPEEVLRKFGNRLRCLRSARQLRQIDMQAYGISYKYYQRLEAGQANPTLLTLYRLATAFCVSVYELMPQ